MNTFEIADLQQKHAESDQLYLEFLHESSMSMGLYVLAAGAKDPQSVHNEDEVYVVLQGQGQIMVDGENRPVQEGSVVFVAKHIEHRFHSISEELQVLVFFAPAES
ncbi:MAG: cupin domain-containing protein [Chloroflexi bacterium]|nr:cupin domain-containing protein [Chloroflexota bacterium]